MLNFTKRGLLGALGAVGLTGPAHASDAQGGKTPDETSAQDRAAFPYEIVTVTGAAALDEWTRLKSAGRGWPVVIGDDEALETIIWLSSPDNATLQPVADILKASESIAIPKDLKAWQVAYGYGDMEEPVGEWPSHVPNGDLGLTVATDILTGKPLEKVHIVLVPTDNSWEAPAFLHWGGSNACPPAEYHVAIVRQWHEQFGAELAGMGGDVINLQITRPVSDRKQAMALAREQYIYCADIVDQGVGDISTLAATLMGQGWWFFWWD